MSDGIRLGWAMLALCVVAYAAADVRAQAPPNSWWDRYRGAAPPPPPVEAPPLLPQAEYDTGDTRPASLLCPEVPKSSGVPRVKMYILGVDAPYAGTPLRQLWLKTRMLEPGPHTVTLRQQFWMLYPFHRDVVMAFVAHPGKQYHCTLDTGGEIAGSTRILEVATQASVGVERSTTCFHLGTRQDCAIGVAPPAGGEVRDDP